jgi:hypothetical protein
MTEQEPVPVREVAPEEPPPILETWPRLYTAILLYLIFLVAGLYAFERIFS